MKRKQWIKIAAIAAVGAAAVTALIVGYEDIAALVGAVGTVVTGIATGLIRSPGDAAKALPLLLAVGLTPVITGCAGAQVSAESARVVACDQVEEQWVSQAEDGELSVDEAEGRVACTRLVCDELHDAIIDAGAE